MSIKTWKNKELTTLLSEAWGFGFNLDNLNEDTGFSGGELTRGEAEKEESTSKKKGKKPYVSKREREGNIEEEIDEAAERRGLAKRRGRPMSDAEAEAEEKRADAEAEADWKDHPWTKKPKGAEVTQDYEEDLDEAAKGSRTGRRGHPMTPEEEEKEGYDPTAETWKRGVKGKEVDLDEDKPYTAKKEKPGEDIRKGAEKRGAEGTKKKTAGKGRGEKKGDDAYANESMLREDSGEDEAWHDWKNEHADDDHIREIEHHLRALKSDRDYERHGADYEDDSDLDEGGSGRSDPTRLQGRDSARDLPDRKRPMEEQAIRRMVRRTIRKIYQENKK